MTLLRLVADLIEEDGCGTADTVHAKVAEHGYTRAQVLQALKNAKRVGRVITDGSGRGLGLATYYPPRSPMRQMVRTMTGDEPVALVASVFSQDKPITLPAPPAVRKINTPLGPWNSEGA
jgi:hypothetical protein